MLLHGFIEHKLDQLPSIEDLLTKDEEWVFKELKSNIGEGSNKRLDISSIISRRLMNYAMVNHDKFKPKMVENYQKMLESDYLSQDLVLLSLQNVTKKKEFAKMLTNSKTLQNKLLGV